MTGERMTRKQVAAFLQVSEVSVYRWTQDGRLPAYRFGRSVRYKRADVEAMGEPVEPDAEEVD